MKTKMELKSVKIMLLKEIRKIKWLYHWLVGGENMKNQLDKVKMLFEMLEENIKLLEDYSVRVDEYDVHLDEMKEKHPNGYYYYTKPYPK